MSLLKLQHVQVILTRRRVARKHFSSRMKSECELCVKCSVRSVKSSELRQCVGLCVCVYLCLCVYESLSVCVCVTLGIIGILLDLFGLPFWICFHSRG